MSNHACSTALLIFISVFAEMHLQGATAADSDGWNGAHATFYTGSSQTMGTLLRFYLC